MINIIAAWLSLSAFVMAIGGLVYADTDKRLGARAMITAWAWPIWFAIGAFVLTKHLLIAAEWWPLKKGKR